MDIKKLSEALVAFVPADSEGLLIIKLIGYEDQESVGVAARHFSTALKGAGLRCGLLVTQVDEYKDFELHHLTDEQLFEIGFTRIYSEFK